MELAKLVSRPTDILPLVLFRIGFGLLMFASTLRFVVRGWVEANYVTPQFHFTYLGFGWVQPLPAAGMYAVFALLALFALAITVGLCYRASIAGFFVLFTYVELLDKTFYLNHYYFVSLLSFLLIFLPLHRAYSLDAWLRPRLHAATVPLWTIGAIRLHLGLVYIFAGVAKLNPDWLLAALPLKIWLRGHTGFPLLGPLFDYAWVAYAMSWSGAAYDLGIVALLCWRRTRPLGYLAVLGFHLMTALLFPIGVFPWVMIVCTTIFFSAEEWRRGYTTFQRLVRRLVAAPGARPVFGFAAASIAQRHAAPDWLDTPASTMLTATSSGDAPRSTRHNHGRLARSATTFLPTRSTIGQRLRAGVLIGFFALQLLMPLRHWFYPGDVLWTEEGFRFSWRVMLVEKTGVATFAVRDPASGREWLVYPDEYLSYQQGKQMAFQPDMIVQFAHFVEQEYRRQGYANVEVRAEAYVSMNGRPSRLLLDPTVDLSEERNTLAPKPWVLR